MIVFKNVTFQYKGGACGAAGLDLVIPDGAFVVLAGDSGCGKTTVTRLVNGLAPHYFEGELAGEVLVNGIDTRRGIGALAAHVGSVFQNPKSQFFNVDAASELAFAPENLGAPPEKIRADMERVVREMRLAPLMDRSIFALSGGEKQQIACGAVAVAGPGVMVLDEPSSNLDAAAAQRLAEALALWKAQGKTVLIAEHRLSYLRELADEMLLMREGRVVRRLGREEFLALDEAGANALGLRSPVPVTMPDLSAPSELAPDAPHLLCKNFAHHYRDSGEGIDIAELRLALGRVTAITGLNGAGKTTFARVLCGLERGCRGVVELDGETWRTRERPRLCFMIMQDVNHQLFTDSVLEELLLSMTGDRADEEEKKRRAREVLAALNLEEQADAHPMALSGGQKQRVAVACGIVSERPVLVFDEPTSGLDLAHMRRVAGLLREAANRGRAVIVITHDAELVRACADAAVRLEGGKIADAPRGVEF